MKGGGDEECGTRQGGRSALLPSLVLPSPRLRLVEGEDHEAREAPDAGQCPGDAESLRHVREFP